MWTMRRIAVAVAGAGLLTLAGVAVAQQVGPELDAARLADELGLDAEQQAQIAPQIEELNALLSRIDRSRAADQQLWTDLRDAQAAIAEQLTAEQRRRFGSALRQAWSGSATGSGWCAGSGPAGHGPMGGHMRGSYMGGHMNGGGMHGMGGFMPGGPMSYPGGGGPGAMHGGWTGPDSPGGSGGR